MQYMKPVQELLHMLPKGYIRDSGTSWKTRFWLRFVVPASFRRGRARVESSWLRKGRLTERLWAVLAVWGGRRPCGLTGGSKPPGGDGDQGEQPE